MYRLIALNYTFFLLLAFSLTITAQQSNKKKQKQHN